MQAILLSLGLALALSPAYCQTLYSTGFESPEFLIGNLTGQNGWQAFHLSAPNQGTVSNALALSGSQSARIQPVNGASSSWWWKPINHNTGGSGYVTILWDMYVGSGTVPSAYGIDCYDPETFRIAGMLINEQSRVLMVQTNGFNTTLIDTRVTYTRGTWARFKLELNYNTMTFRLVMNNQLLGTADINSAVDTIFADADLWISNATGNANDFAHYDNFQVIASDAPLPDQDVNGDGCVDDADLLAVLFAFGSDDPSTDLNRDGVVDDADLLAVLFAFGSGC